WDEADRVVTLFFFFFQAEDGIRDWSVTGVQTCALPIFVPGVLQTGSTRRFEGAVAVITGGSKGIGLAIASRLAREGARVAINGRDETELAHALRKLEKEGADACAMAGGITQPPRTYKVAQAPP